jgi:hypothetical protein
VQASNSKKEKAEESFSPQSTFFKPPSKSAVLNTSLEECGFKYLPREERF